MNDNNIENSEKELTSIIEKYVKYDAENKKDLSDEEKKILEEFRQVKNWFTKHGQKQ